MGNHDTTHPQEALGRSESFLTFQERLSKAARVDRPVLVIGERGTGKELAAARLHFLSPRWREPLVALNCAALSPSLIESELFGHEAGAFTGADRRRAGRFESAHGGTLFLDEIGSIPMEAQEKILRAVEYGTFERVGGSSPVTVDVRIVGATNADLPALAARGRFKADLLDRLSFEVLHLPPLRQRGGDVMFLASHFAVRMAHELGRPAVPVFSDRAAAALEDYPWPGNVRELKNVVERAVYLAESDRIDAIVFNPFPGCRPRPEPAPASAGMPVVSAEKGEGYAGPVLDRPLTEQVRDLEVSLLQAALEKARFNQRRAAGILGLTYNQFRSLYRKHGGPERFSQGS